jgi:hypothetical protein
MPTETTRYSLEEAVAKYSLKTSLSLKCAGDGVIRIKMPVSRSMQVIVDDSEL